MKKSISEISGRLSNRQVIKFVVELSLGILLLVLQPSLFAQQYIIKFATLAPEGSTWMNVMKEYDRAVRKESGGHVGFKIYPGGVQGDEKDVLRKIRLGQLHSAGITGNGMTTIAPKTRVLDAPFLFKTYDEADHIYQKFDEELSKALEEGGYVNLGWAEVGFVYVFTNTPVEKPSDLKNVKMWMWEGDPIAEVMFKAFDISPIPLSIADVLTSLQTKLIDGVYTTPYIAVAFQWFTRVKFMVKVPLADASGAVVISKKKYDELPPDLQEILLRNGKQYIQKLTRLIREDNAKSIETLKKSGVTILDPPSQKILDVYDEIGKKARRLPVGSLYSADLLNRIEQSILEYRNQHKTSK